MRAQFSPQSSTSKLSLLLFSLLAIACGSDGGPKIAPLQDQVVAVGSELVVEITASNKGGSPIDFTYNTDASIESGRGGLTQRPGGSAVFSWTPSAQDIGIYSIDFHASDSSGKATETIRVEVKSAVGADTLPIFRRPLGAGTALDLATDECVDIEIVISDQDSARVTLSQEDPRIEGAQLSQEQDLQGRWHWCPSKQQQAAQDRYMLTLGADDSDNAIALKRYQIILRDSSEQICPGQPPVIDHTAQDVETATGVVLRANVRDDQGIRGAVSLYYSESPPSSPPDLGSMTFLPMNLASGNILSGNWEATLPNPVVDQAVGTTKTLYYTIVADDNDDRTGSCDHSTLASYQIVITNAGGAGGLGSCEPCTSDRQCGGDSDLCIAIGQESELFCFSSCESDDACSAGYHCSQDALTSADGSSGRQCIPDDQSCTDLGCEDDAYEQNDGIGQSKPIEVGTISNLRMCPFRLYAADEDWFKVTITEDSQATFSITGAEDPNIDLRLLSATGELIAVSEDFGSSDSLSRCLPAGTYYLRAYSYLFYQRYVDGVLQDMGNDYQLTYALSPSDCSTPTLCSDDVFEDDDDLASSRVPDFGGLSQTEWSATGNQTCSRDQDWYLISAYNNLNHISASLTFTQNNSNEDLDLLIYDNAGQLLTQCTEDDLSGCSSNGQSSTSNEHLSFMPPPECSLPFDCSGCAPCDYYVVVNGFAGSENAYDICIGYDSSDRCL